MMELNDMETACEDTTLPTVEHDHASRPIERFVKWLRRTLKSIMRSLYYSINNDKSGSFNPKRYTILKTSLVVYLVVFLLSVVVNKTTHFGVYTGRAAFNLNLDIQQVHHTLGYTASQNTVLNGIRETPYANIPDESINGSYGNIDSRTLQILGSMDTNHLRIYGEWFRMFTANLLHGNWTHLINNVIVHTIVLYVIEPDWGFYRTLVAYFVSGCGGYLVGSVFVPCFQQVGSSGVQMGFIGCIIPYCVENWYNMGSPMIVLLISLTIAILDLIISQQGISSHIHTGGYVFGVLYGFSTIKCTALFDRGAIFYRLSMRIFSRFLSENFKLTCQNKIAECKEKENAAQDNYQTWINETPDTYKSIKRILGIYPHGPYRMRWRDIITRIVAATMMFILFTFLLMGLLYEGLYTKLTYDKTVLFSRRCHCCYIKNNMYNSDMLGNLNGNYYCFNSIKKAAVYC